MIVNICKRFESIEQGGLIKVNTPPYYVIVERQPYGTFLPINTNHPDETPIRKVIVSLDAGWLTEPVDGSGTSDLFKLSEFGGGLNSGDFLFVSRSADGTTGESVKVTAFSGVFTKTFRVEDGADERSPPKQQDEKVCDIKSFIICFCCIV